MAGRNVPHLRTPTSVVQNGPMFLSRRKYFWRFADAMSVRLGTKPAESTVFVAGERTTSALWSR
jgi:hypothetical protein